MDWDTSNVTPTIVRPQEMVDLIRENSSVVTYPAKTVFLEPGDNMNGIIYIAEGRTRHYMVAMDGTEKILYTLSPGWFFGETSRSLNEPTGLYSAAETATTVYKIDTANYERLMGINEQFRNAILESFSKKMLILRHEVENLSFNSCKERLKRLYCSTVDPTSLVDGSWYNQKVRYTQYELSIIVGGARVTINKLINELCAEGFLRVLNRNTQISAKAYEKYIRQAEKRNTGHNA